MATPSDGRVGYSRHFGSDMVAAQPHTEERNPVFLIWSDVPARRPGETTATTTVRMMIPLPQIPVLNAHLGELLLE